MVTQANWEKDVIWNGDDIKNNVLQKLNSKSNAAGWVPSSYNRTAGSMTGKLTGIKTSISNVAKVNLSTKCVNICKKIHKTARL